MKSITSHPSRKRRSTGRHPAGSGATRTRRTRAAACGRPVTVATFTTAPRRTTALTNLFAVVVLYAGGAAGGRIELVHGIRAARQRADEINRYSATLDTTATAEVIPADLRLVGAGCEMGAFGMKGGRHE